MVVVRAVSVGVVVVALALACGSGTSSAPGAGGGGASSAGKGGSGAGAPSGGVGGAGTAGASRGGATSGGGGNATSGSAGNAGAGAAGGGTGTAGQSGAAGAAGTSSAGSTGLPPYLGPGVACQITRVDEEKDRCPSGQVCCQIRLGASHCEADAAACDPCPEPGECTAIACDEPADCPDGSRCCAELGSGNGGVELARLTCQKSCSEEQYVICAQDSDCPSEFTDCGISSMGIRRCFH